MRNLLPAFLSLLLSTTVAAAAEPPVAKVLVPDLVASAEVSTWDGPQIVRSDRVGNVYFLRADTLEIYPLTQAGKLGEPVKLEVLGEAPQLVRDAALSPGGDVWLLSADLGLRRFVDGKEKVMPALEWRPSGIGFERDEPVVALLPMAVSGDQVYRERKGQIPRLMTFDGDRWNVLAEYPNLSAADWGDRRPDLNGALTDHAAFVTSDPEGRLWIARQYAYDIEQLTPSGKPRLHFVVDGGKVKERKQEGESKDRPTGLNAFRSQAAIFDLVEGRDHRMYFLAAGGDAGSGIVLDRHDPVNSRLERISLAIHSTGRLTLASGKNGLYLAAWDGRGGRWMISWDALDLATWKPVQNSETSPAPETPTAKPSN